MSEQTPTSKKPEATSYSVGGVGSSAFRPADVLLGRGSGPNRWEGNVEFRKVVLKTYQSYREKSAASGKGHVHTFSSMDPFVKNQLARDVLAVIQGENGRFLQKLSKKDFEKVSKNADIPIVHEAEEGTGDATATFVYVEATPKKAMEKIKQTFRFLTDQKHARRLSKELSSTRLSQQAVKASFASATGGSLPLPSNALDPLARIDGSANLGNLSPTKLSQLLALQGHSLQGGDLLSHLLPGMARSTNQANFLSSGTSGSTSAAASSPASLAYLMANFRPPQHSAVPSVSREVAALQEAQAQRRILLERELLLSARVSEAYQEQLLRQQLFPQGSAGATEPRTAIEEGNQNALDLSRFLALRASAGRRMS